MDYESDDFRQRLFCLLLACNIFILPFILPPINAYASNVSQTAKSYHNYIKGLLLDESGQFDKAKQAYQKAAGSDFQSWGIHYRLGLDYVRLGDFKKAEKELKLVLSLRPFEERVRFLLALVYSYGFKYESAIREYHKLLERPLLELDETEVRYSLAQVYLTKKDIESAEKEYKTILKNNPLDSDAHFFLGYVYSESSRIDSAIEEFNQAIQINPSNPPALNSLSYLYAELGVNLDFALELVKKALEFEPSNGAYLDTLGWVYFKKGDLEKALSFLKNASVALEDAEIYEHLGDVYLELGDANEARKYWRKSLKIEPQRKQIKDKIKKIKIRDDSTIRD